MKIRLSPFNIYLVGACALVLVFGCKTEESERKKIVSTIRVHLEARADPMGKTDAISVDRANPVKLTIDKSPFLTEGSVKEAKVVDVIGGFVLQLQLDKEGAMLLEEYTSANPGKHMAIFSQFRKAGTKDINESRWLAGPRITGHITDGVLAFTPDATREEADMIALGLNNVSKKLETGQEPKW
jgi:preprotein translocase subunit SecD